MVNLNRFYTYAYLRVDRSPYYIGKGTKRRIYSNYGRPCNKPKDKSRIIFLKQNLTEEEAFKHEMYMIAVFGRKDLGTGILHNKTGGGEGCSGMVHSEETKEKLSVMNTGEKNAAYGRHRSQESNKKQSETMMNRKWWKDEYGNTSLSLECPGEGWVLGRETINCDKKWWKDEYGNTTLSLECPGEGWILGRGNINENKHWWNDGNGNRKFCIECPGEGWVLGSGNSRKQVA